MLNLFRVRPDYASAGNGLVDGMHEWGLPGVDCTGCGSTWGVVGPAYPSVDLSTLSNEEVYRNSWPVSLEEFVERRRPILPLMPDASVPEPGTPFGPLIGKARGVFTDFVWLNPWAPLIQSRALDRLREAGVRTPIGVPPFLRFRGKNPPALLELQIEPHGKMAPAAVTNSEPSCLSCGRNPNSVPEHIVIDALSIPKDLDLFRAEDFPTVILATQKFVEAAEALKLRGIGFHQVAVE